MVGCQAATADQLRIATYAAPLSRDGPGLLLRDLGRDDPEIDAIISVIAEIRPDILLLTDFDYDYDSLALSAFAARTGYDYTFALRPNTGIPSGLDIDGNGRTGDARDALGYGRFAGDGGMAVLSRYPFGDATDLSRSLWRDLPDAVLPMVGDAPFLSDEVTDVLPVSTSGHWILPVRAPNGPVSLMAFAATPPVFDGDEDMNGLRNREGLRLWSHVLDGHFGAAPPDFVVLGNANLDPADGQGHRDAMAAFLSDPRLIDPAPDSSGAAAIQDPSQQGSPALDTADWPDDGPGNLRVSYVLPAATFRVIDAGVFWPAPDDPAAALLGDDGLAAGVHHLVWVDVIREP